MDFFSQCVEYSNDQCVVLKKFTGYANSSTLIGTFVTVAWKYCKNIKPTANTMPATYESALDKEEQDVLNQIRKELFLEKPTDVVPFMASVLQALRQTLTLEHATQLMNKLPDFMKVVFASNWKKDEVRVQISHLDEFVGLVMARDQQEKKHLFKSEVQTLSIVILVLKKMYKLADIKNFDGLSPMFRQELSDASIEVVAA